MSHTKIASKILEVMKAIPDEQSFGKLNETLIAQKLITKTEYEISESKEKITPQGVAWQFVTVSCTLTIIDTESDEILVNIAFGSGVDQGDKAVVSAQKIARRHAWLGTLNIAVTDTVPDVQTVSGPVTDIPEFVVETPESKLIAEIKALWKWGESEMEPYFAKRRGKKLSELNIPELTVERDDLKSYIRGNG